MRTHPRHICVKCEWILSSCYDARGVTNTAGEAKSASGFKVNKHLKVPPFHVGPKYELKSVINYITVAYVYKSYQACRTEDKPGQASPCHQFSVLGMNTQPLPRTWTVLLLHIAVPLLKQNSLPIL